ncbi:ubiquitin-protein ligase peroxin 12 [Serendipita sp. 399]|nr:ubiquitin-protein ligase peroxin 12 [Serendipita sp. 399]
MKFGKRILSERIPGWFEYYLDYKALKKIISSVHTADQSVGNDPNNSQMGISITPLDMLQAGSHPVQPLWEPPIPLEAINTPLSATLAANSFADQDRSPDFQMKKAEFFFKLQRELDKINAFYLQKEAELKLRMITLLSKRQAAANRISPDPDEQDTVKNHVEWKAVTEGFTLLQNDLLKLQQFVDINAIGFRKILKKWDKRSKSTTKELYLVRQVEVQPVFNRQLITEFSDTVAACLLNLTDSSIPISATLREELSLHDSVLNAQLTREPLTRSRAFLELESTVQSAVATNDAAAIQQALITANDLTSAPDGRTFVARILWKSAIDAGPELGDLILDSPTSPCDFKFVDDINGRTCMHEAAVAGALRLVDKCIAKGVDVNRRDLYGRTALHYAVISGHVEVVRRLLAASADTLVLDMENFSSLYYAVLYGHLDCVRALLQTGTELSAQDHDFNLLSVACQYGHVDIVTLLLEKGARHEPNTNGEYPIHLAAGAGHDSVCRLLAKQARETLDIPDKFNEWTPLFHAAHKGRTAVVKTLLEASCNSQVTDEHGRTAIFYAGWYGHIECVSLLLEKEKKHLASTRVPPVKDHAPKAEPDLTELDTDLIPSLSLPPPIMPFRIYGHNYLDKQYLVQITLGRPYSRYHASIEPVIITAWSSDHPIGTPHPRPHSLLKMVMTSRSQNTAIPVSLTIPLSEERDVITFQVQDISELSLEFSFYPKFGSKTIGRAAVLSSVFENVKDSKIIALAILDHRLHIIGRVEFEARIIRPFTGATLQLGGAIETYWKSSGHVPQKSDHTELLTVDHSALDSTHTSPSNRSILMGSSGSMIVSSLSHEFLTVVVQGTRDHVPVVYPEWNLPVDGLNIGVSDVTCTQFTSIASKNRRHLSGPPSRTVSVQDWATLLGNAMLTLEGLLAILPPDLGVNLNVAYPNRAIRDSYSLGHWLDLNSYVESILMVIYRAASTQSRRKLCFLSFSPSVCTALNWKQPNFPALIQGSKDSNLLLGAFGDTDEVAILQSIPGPPIGRPDATWARGVVRFIDNTNLAAE